MGVALDIAPVEIGDLLRRAQRDVDQERLRAGLADRVAERAERGRGRPRSFPRGQAPRSLRWAGGAATTSVTVSGMGTV